MACYKPQTDFTNKVDYGRKDEIPDFSVLEPRLQEYIRKKDMYAKNKINPTIPPEQEYRMTPKDLQLVKDFKEGNIQKLTQFNPMETKPVSSSCGELAWLVGGRTPLEQLTRCDQKYRDLANLGNDSCYVENRSLRSVRPGVMNTSRYNNEKNCSEWKQARNQVAWHEPGVMYTDGYVNREEIDTESYLKYVFDPKNGESSASYLDLDYKIVQPQRRLDSSLLNEPRDLNHAYYMAVPFMGHGRGRNDVDAETDIIQGISSRTDRSKIGEWYVDRFEELDKDIQDPDHIVLPWPRGGIDTRYLEKYSRKRPARII
jgi:hypothetical protein